MLRLRYDFNELGRDGDEPVALLYPEDGPVVTGQVAELYDGDGNTMTGVVKDFRVAGSGRILVTVALDPGSWKPGDE